MSSGTTLGDGFCSERSRFPGSSCYPGSKRREWKVLGMLRGPVLARWTIFAVKRYLLLFTSFLRPNSNK